MGEVLDYSVFVCNKTWSVYPVTQAMVLSMPDIQALFAFAKRQKATKSVEFMVGNVRKVWS